MGAGVLHASGLVEGESVCQSSDRKACLLPIVVIIETWPRESLLRLVAGEVAGSRAWLRWTAVGDSLALGQVGRGGWRSEAGLIEIEEGVDVRVEG